jgi:hypothetical protein
MHLTPDADGNPLPTTLPCSASATAQNDTITCTANTNQILGKHQTRT